MSNSFAVMMNFLGAILLVSIVCDTNALTKNDFPSDFLFGASTSAYQVEGAANEDGRKPSIWDTYAYADNGIQPHVTLYHWDLPQVLEDEYGGWVSRRIIKDFTAYADVCFREFGDRVKYWTTLNEGNACSIGGYDGGFLPPQRCSSSSFSNCSKGNSSTEPYLVTHHMLLAHASAARLYRTKYKAKQRGFIGFNLIVFGFVPLTNTSDDIIATRRARDFFIGWFLNPFIFGEYPNIMKKNVGSRLPYFTTKESYLVKGSIDFLGINFYYAYYIKNNAKSLQKKDRDYISDMAAYFITYSGNDMSPYEIPVVPDILIGELHSLKNDYGNFPIYIHENGQQTSRNSSLDDWSRVKCMHEYIGSLLDMLRNGLNIRGYFVWSFLDVFELLLGYETSFGLYYIDLKDPTLRRQPKLSSVWYSNFLNNMGSKFSMKIEENSYVLSPNTSMMHAIT